MLKRIINIKSLIVVLALCTLQVNLSAQNSQADQEDFRTVLADHLGEAVTNTMLIGYMTSSEDNINFLKEVQNAQKNNPRYSATYFNNLIAGMELKTSSNNKSNNRGKKKKE